MRRFKLKTTAGQEDISCDDFDESETEFWFIYYKKPRIVFQKCNVISIEEQQPPDPRLRRLFEAKAKEMRDMHRRHELDYNA